MPKHYVTFGTDHVHKINGKIFHSDVVARFDALNPVIGRMKTFEYFRNKFSFEYHETEWNEDESLHFYKNGYLDVEDEIKTFTREEVLSKLDECALNTDQEASHADADEVLLDLLESLGYKDVVDKFKALPKWYA